MSDREATHAETYAVGLAVKLAAAEKRISELCVANLLLTVKLRAVEANYSHLAEERDAAEAKIDKILAVLEVERL